MDNDKIPCSGCAFSKAGAGLEPYNALRARVAALGPVPFFCHHNINWKETRGTWRGQELIGNCRTAGICQGWKKEVSRMNALGVYRGPYQAIRRHVAAECLAGIGMFVDEEIPRRKAKLKKTIRRMIHFLTAKDVSNLKIPSLGSPQYERRAGRY